MLASHQACSDFVCSPCLVNAPSIARAIRLRKIRRTDSPVGGFQRTPGLHWRLVIREEQFGFRIRMLHRKRDALSAMRSGDDHPVLEGLLLIGRTSIDGCPLPREYPPMQGWKRAEGKDADHLTLLNMRSQRILLSPCWAAFCLENQTNEARPTIWVSGTKPHMRESAERCRLSPIIQ